MDPTADTVPRSLYEAAEARVTALLAQVAALNARLDAVTAQAEAREAAAAAERAKLQVTVDALFAKLEEVLAKKSKKSGKGAPAGADTSRGGAAPAPDALSNRPQPPAAPPKDEEEKPRKARTSKPAPDLRSRAETSRPTACVSPQESGESAVATLGYGSRDAPPPVTQPLASSLPRRPWA